MGDFLTRAAGAGNSFAAQQAPIDHQNFNPGIQQSAGQFNQTFNNQNSLAQQLQAQAMGQGPNPAQQMLKAGTDRAIQQGSGMLASQKGISPAMAQRLAAQFGAQQSQQAAGQGAMMGAQQQLGAMNQLSGLYGQQQQGALGMNSTLQNAQAAQNNAIVGNTNSMNTVNAGVAAQNAATAGKAVGGLLGGAASSLFAKGGMVPENFGFGGAVDMPESVSNGPAAEQKSQAAPAAKGGLLSSIFAHGGTVQKYGYGGAVDMPVEVMSAGLNMPISDVGQYLQAQEKEDKSSPDYGKGLNQLASGAFKSPTEAPTTTGQAGPWETGGGMAGGAGDAMSSSAGLIDAGGAADAAAGAGAAAGAAEGAGGMAGLAAMFASKGGQVPGVKKFALGGDSGDGGGASSLMSLIPLALMALNKGGEPQGQVPGKGAVAGDSLKNDTVPAMVSPREIILPRSITTQPNAPQRAAEFVRQELKKHHQANGSNYDEGGSVGPMDRPIEQPQGINTGFDPNQPVEPTPGNSQAARDFEQYKSRVLMNDPFASEDDASEAALKNVEGAKAFGEERSKANAQQQQEDYAKKVDLNKRMMALGIPGRDLPPPPPQLAGPQDAGTNPALNTIPNMQDVGQSQNPMGAMDKAMAGGYNQAVGQQLAGFNQAANAQGQLGNENARIAQQQGHAQASLAADANNKMQGYMEDYDKAMQDYKDGHINPNHYAESMGSVGKVKTAIGLMLGGIGGGLTGQENPALKFLNQQIERDIDAQKTDLGKKANLLTANLHKMGNLKDATEMTRAMMMGIQASQFQEAAAKAQGPMARATALQEAGKLHERVAPIMAQIGMRQALMGGMKGGGVDPAMAINFMAPEGQKVELMKQYQTAQNMSKQKDNLLNAFDQVNKINTVAGRLTSPLQSSRQAETLTQPLLAQLIKDSEGRITPQDTAMMEGLFPKPGDSDPTRRLKRNQLNKFVSEKMNFPGLDMYGYRPSAGGRFDANGKDRLPPMAPPIK